MLSNVQIWSLEQEHTCLPTVLRNSAKKIIECVWLCCPHQPLEVSYVHRKTSLKTRHQKSSN